MPSVRDLVRRAAELEMPALALTDNNSIAGLHELETAAREFHIQPILGCELDILPADHSIFQGRTHRLTLLVENEHGYRNLVELITKAHDRPSDVPPHVRFIELERYGKGLIALTGSPRGELYHHLREGNPASTKEYLNRLAAALGRENLFFEIIDPATGSPMEEGKSGEVVFTTLTRRGMPLIRYRTGDISRFLPERCPCGTVLRSMQRVEGRIGGNVKLGATGFLSMTDLDEALFPLAFLLDFSAALTCENGKDRLHIEILARGAGGERTGRLARSALDAIPVVRAAREKGALFVSIGVRREGQSAPGSMGKRRIIDYRYTNEPA